MATVDLSAVKKKIREPKIEDYRLKMVIYGAPGTGKTTFAATAQHHKDAKDVLFLDMNKGLLSVAEESDRIHERPDAIEIDSYEEVREAYQFLVSADHDYQTVVIDTVTDLQELNLEYIVQEELDKSSQRGKKRDGLDDRWREDYGKSTSQLTRLARNFRDLPMHVIFIAHKRTDQDDQKRETVSPALTPKLQENVVGAVDLCGYFHTATDEETDEEVFRALWAPKGKWVAKDRTPGMKLGGVMTDPTIPKCLNRIRGESDER